VLKQTKYVRYVQEERSAKSATTESVGVQWSATEILNIGKHRQYKHATVMRQQMFETQTYNKNCKSYKITE